ncbi:putative lipoprotein-anchoring transpeptidase, ErfK/SrfK family [Arcobacter acticola]|jgi:lipoprotein-anchoring transpeptidase ErfK/SrfK|uniref:Putative lipoprotein-anchoring transpeptidase, ErfK/SrfK family n=1 Tax=Arcobacter acticola TaxID=1849015 RepID=A0A6M8ELB3_9BACT|nr:L,D-transpeptidase [Arcobacter acticola]QKE27691.1 putative lipoprotein-anchoring transpeptidase, ErfK/SrfK family [Arcobacter acticola]
MIKMFLTLFVVLGSLVSVVAAEKYTISVCMTLSLDNALVCKKRIFDNMDGKVFIVKDKDERYYTYLDIFDNKNDALLVINKASPYVKQQKPYIKEISEEITALYSKKKTLIDLTQTVKKDRIQEVFIIDNNEKKIEEKVKQKKAENNQEIVLVSSNPEFEELKLVSSYPFYEGQKLSDDDYLKEQAQEEAKKIEEIKLISMDEFDKADDEKRAVEEQERQLEKPIEEPKKKVLLTNQIIEKTPNTQILDKVENKVENKIENKKEQKEIVEVVMNNPEDEPTILNYEELIIEVNANTNLMTVNAKINNELKEIKEYVVSTAKKDVKRPFGEGKISKISLNPIWYPTQDTLKTFRKRGINLPSVVPPGHKYNYMGAAKINLTHIVDGKNTYRIHGTLSEKTIGTNESAGCIRMKNSDVLQLAALINDFSQIKSLNEVKVILK